MENLIMRYQKEKEGQTTAEHSFHSDQCSDCVKTKESMMREIENLKLNLQLYDGHGLNLLTYDELLSFELHLESSLQHARARKSEFMHQQQQQQTDQKLKGKEKGQGSSWEQLMWQAERQMMTCQRQKDPAPANEGGVPFLRLFGEKRMVTIGDVLEMLQKKKLSSWKKLCLALIVIVDGVVVCNDQSFVTLDFVEMLNDIDFFLEYPWGRKAFLATIRRFGPPKDAPNPLGKLKKRLKQKTSACYGFPLALQLQVFESIPVILERIKDPNDLRDFTERSSEGLSIAFLLRKSYILDAEVDDKLVVAHTLEPKGMINESELVWETEVSDPKVDYILRLINEGHCFKPFEWPHLKAANQEVNIPDIDGDSLEDVTDVSQARPKKPLTRSSKKEKEVVKPPSIHKHTSQEKIKAKVHVGGESNDPGYVTLAYLNDMKEWILKQNQDLRNKIREDVKEIVVGPKSPAGGASNLRQSNRLNTNSKGKTDASPPKKTGNTETRKRKRKQVEVHSLSSGSESAGDIEGEEDVQSTWKEDGNAPSSGTFDECDDYGGALKITQEGDVMQEESDFDHCSSNCTKMKESMMREIENLELKLQLYGGHGLNNLTYDELLHFEHQLESSLHIARAHKF
ncbi:unnamed protein product [Arabidopsis thaliana]|uniref:(thale cress) hypothetical protein n=1 Tax=Arabidopsis thaliana TaxID=3702 RepID=A0A7G2DXB3_ARATH|nr:unnamed protein product [Arabidopsis thaliana]